MITSPPENHPAPPVRLAVVDDDPLVRAGLALMLGGADDIRIVGEAADGADVADLVDRVRPDVVLMDIRMPVVDGLTATEALRARPDAPEVIVLTTFHADEQVLRAIRAGAAGFVLKDTPPAQIVESVRRVAAGDPVLSPAVTRQLMARAAGTGPRGGRDDRVDRADRARRRIAALGEREREVAIAVARGRSNAEIAAALYLSVATVKTQVSRILTRFDFNNRVQIALLVHDSGLLDDDAAEDGDVG
ncbi:MULTISPECIES: response regulator transcription factor [unclassified Streptomyces]|uniref:response regulator transcription factor n=1 Tax=unclassified Streptomyces TaxID=2593676 RepID=UPI0011E6B85A|nr:response regulator transcription factor [Streptomyces sp. sk2.1]TXS68055.1 DNA-binding response regulator [Streptomyces sp. sk2.1]